MVEKIKIEVTDWDGESLEISASNASPGHTSSKKAQLAFQPGFFDTEDVDQIIKSVAQASVTSVEQLENEEKIRNNKEEYEKYQSLIGKQFEFSIEDLYQVDVSDIRDWSERDEIIAKYPVASLQDIEDILFRYYKYLQITPFYRNTDNNVIAVYVNSIGGYTGKAIASAKKLYEDCKKRGVPLISDIGYEDELKTQQDKFVQKVTQYTDLEFIQKGDIHFMSSPWNLEYAKNAKRMQINRDREISAAADIEHKDTKFQADERSRDNLRNLLLGLDSGYTLPTGFTWRDSENNDVRMTKTDLKKLFSKMTGQIVKAYSESFERKTALEEAKTLTEVSEI